MTESHQTARIVETHTGGEPTRVVIGGGPDLGRGTLEERRRRFRQECDRWRTALVGEPRGSDVIVGAVIVEPVDLACAAGVIFFNSVGYLGMCGHGTIGVTVALGHTGRISAGRHRLETPVGTVEVDYDGRHGAAIRNVPSYRHQAGVAVDVPDFGTFVGDVAWGGNWFFLVKDHGQDLSPTNVDQLTAFSLRVRAALAAAGITGADGAEIDHVELFGPASGPHADSRNFVLCPGGAYDRSPCGTGTSAKVACLAADDLLGPGEVWRQESIIGSVFVASYELVDGAVIPTIRGTAYVNAETTLLIDPEDPFGWGIIHE